MDAAECPPVTVEGDWSPAQAKTVKNKLQLYFQSKKKSSGGECRVEAEDGAPRAAVFFRAEEVRERVLARKNHEIFLDSKTVTLRLVAAPSGTNSDGVSDSSTDSKVEGGNEASSADDSDPSAAAVVLENVSDGVSDELLSVLVENISGSDDGDFSLEVIRESSRAVVTFHDPAGVQRFLAAGPTSRKLQKHGLTARPLEAATSVRVESLPPNVVKDLLELHFEKMFALPDDIVMMPEEQAAVLTFRDPKVVQRICTKEDYMMRSTRLKVYPFYESLGTALYGKERPKWKMPEPFTESVHHVVWKFLLMKKLLKSLNDQMRPHFSSVDLDNAEVRLAALPSFLKQKGLTARDVDDWKRTAQEAFRRLMSQYSAFECPVSAPAWKAAKDDVHAVVRQDAVLVLDASREVLTVAGRADDMKRVRAPVENILLKAVSHVERQTNGISEVMPLSPAWLYVLKQDGLQKASLDIFPEMKFSYNEGTQMLTITGLPAEVYQTKTWILERNLKMSRKQPNVPLCLVDFLRTMDSMDMSQDLFTSQGISAVYSVESEGILLLGSSDRILADAERKMKEVLSYQMLDVEDPEVLKLHSWTQLTEQLLDTYNSSKKKTVVIQFRPERRDKLTVVGFVNPVKEVGRSLKEFVANFSRVQENFRVESCAAAQFIDKKKSNIWSKMAEENHVSVRFDPKRPRIVLAGARLHVQKVKSCFQKLAGALFTDTLTVDKPGAKKYFQSQGSMVLSTIMMEFSCVVMLRPEIQDDEEEEEDDEEDNNLCFCKVQTASGVLVSVSMADICSFRVDAVVNAANEELQHIGGLALALLKAAGPQLQKSSNEYVTQNGHLRPGEAIVTGAYNLPCKYVVHAVGPRFSDFDRKTSVSLLKAAVKESLRRAETVGCSAVALPAISSGIFGFPVELCSETIARAVREICDSSEGLGSITEIHLVDNNDNTVRIMAAAVNTEFSDLGPTMTVPRQTGGGASGHQRGRGRGRGQSQPPWGGARGRGGAGGRGGGGGRGGAGGRGGGRGGRAGSLQASRGGPISRGNTRLPGLGEMQQATTGGLKMFLRQGNIQDQTTDVIVNTVAENLLLDRGAVSKALLQAAGNDLQLAVLSAAGATAKQSGDVVVTGGGKLRCQKVFHAVCPFWDDGGGRAEQELKSIIRFCLDEADQLQMASLSFPAIGTGNLSFPRDVVSRVLVDEIRRAAPRHLTEVVVVVHPSDRQTVECFSRQFSGQTGPRNLQRATDYNLPALHPVSQSQHSSASFSLVSSPSLGVYRMQMGQLTLEVSSGDITKEASDVIVNSSNQDFTLKAGVSKAILDSAGRTVELECLQIVSSPGYQPQVMIMTSAGQLPSSNILHVIGQKDPAKIKEVVYAVLKACEEKKFSSVCFPALGTGQGGASPAAVANAMVDAVVDLVRKKHSRFVRSVKILIFQSAMLAEFHKSMKRREGEQVEEKSLFTKVKDKVSSFFAGLGDEQPSSDSLVLEKEEFEPTVFQLCSDDDKAVSRAKVRIQEMILAEQAQRTIADPFIRQLSQADMDELNALQGKLTVRISLDRQQDQEPTIHLEGLTRDVFTADSKVRDILQQVERTENLKAKALLLSGLVEWQFQDQGGTMVPFDMYTNVHLEEALEKRRAVTIEINGRKFTTEPWLKKAVSANGHQQVELLRKELKDDAALPSNWVDMKGDIVKLFPVTAGSQEYNDVQTEVTNTGLVANIIMIERVQNTTLWQSYQLMKKQLEVKNKHTNNERLLFHGTSPTAIDFINNQGFNRSHAGAHGVMYGNGSYFAVDPVYSARNYARPDTNGHKRMYQAKVLVGDFTQGRQGLITPPSKNTGNAADLYDSVTDNATTPTMFVIFSDMQAYPEYLVTFT
ncbi:protein mono-ADP-ribosyltransferase PARP14-like [Brachyistius frenatus]|uniref:protein mono-ADP-ribosyltransferase PARP14-like n=1 Tax=Brachyistius frenatus TaxID=100188 RepID=UPI0037E9089F